MAWTKTRTRRTGIRTSARAPGPTAVVSARTRLFVRVAKRLLRERAPVELPLRVVFSGRLGKGEDATCTTLVRRDEPDVAVRCVIRLRPGMSACRTVESLAHEWGHALAYPSRGHSSRWGACFARAYRIVAETA